MSAGTKLADVHERVTMKNVSSEDRHDMGPVHHVELQVAYRKRHQNAMAQQAKKTIQSLLAQTIMKEEGTTFLVTPYRPQLPPQTVYREYGLIDRVIQLETVKLEALRLFSSSFHTGHMGGLLVFRRESRHRRTWLKLLRSRMWWHERE
eukprot:5140015-Amphidinium_carterae.1